VRVRALVGGILGPCDLGQGRGHGQAQGACGARLADSPDGKAVRGFLRLAGYYHWFIRNFGPISTPLAALLKKEGFRWTDVAEWAFHDLQHALTSAPVLKPPAFDQDFIVECDASGSGEGAVLHQGAIPVAFFSRPIVARHAKLAAYERELIGLVQAVRH
jgi:hypothetical protein